MIFYKFKSVNILSHNCDISFAITKCTLKSIWKSRFQHLRFIRNEAFSVFCPCETRCRCFAPRAVLRKSSPVSVWPPDTAQFNGHWGDFMVAVFGAECVKLQDTGKLLNSYVWWRTFHIRVLKTFNDFFFGIEFYFYFLFSLCHLVTWKTEGPCVKFVICETLFEIQNLHVVHLSFITHMRNKKRRIQSLYLNFIKKCTVLAMKYPLFYAQLFDTEKMR